MQQGRVGRQLAQGGGGLHQTELDLCASHLHLKAGVGCIRRNYMPSNCTLVPCGMAVHMMGQIKHPFPYPIANNQQAQMIVSPVPSSESTPRQKFGS